MDITHDYYKAEKLDSLYLHVCAIYTHTCLYIHTHACTHRDFTADGKTVLFSGQSCTFLAP